MTQVFIQERSHVNRGFHALEEGNNVDTTLLLEIIPRCSGCRFDLVQNSCSPLSVVLGGLFKGATRATAVDSGWR